MSTTYFYSGHTQFCSDGSQRWFCGTAIVEEDDPSTAGEIMNQIMDYQEDVYTIPVILVAFNVINKT